MKVIAINGSARKDGNTAILVNYVLRELESEGIDGEMIQLSGRAIRGCMACYQCFEKKDQRCSNKSDIVNECIEKIIEADGVILASPTYFSDVTAELKALIDRAGLVAIANGNLFKRKVSAAVIAVRRGGEIHAFDTINHFYLQSEMIVPGSIYWNMGFGLDQGEVESDEEGIRTMKTLGQNMAWLMKKIQA
ncbi:MAG: flavodoxin family protein [Candidatus Hinthialibacter antarcticus]|nr:flavodoxin family protein [Candidatus Hinthialibacter antarcticus]